MIRLALLTLTLAACDQAPAPEAPAAPAPVVEEPAAMGPHGADEAEPVHVAPGEEAHYGADFTLADASPAATLLADPAAFEGQTIRVAGRVAEVCQKAGCWLVLTSEDQSMRVTMKEHGFGVDKLGTGADCEVEGTVVALEVDPERVEHFRSESPEGAAMPEEAAEAGKTWELVATAVTLRRPA